MRVVAERPQVPEGATREQLEAALAAQAEWFAALKQHTRELAIAARRGEDGGPGFCSSGLSDFLAGHGLPGVAGRRPGAAAAAAAPDGSSEGGESFAWYTDEGLAGIFAKRAAAHDAWIARVREAALSALDGFHMTRETVAKAFEELGFEAPKPATRVRVSATAKWNTAGPVDAKAVEDAVKAALIAVAGDDAPDYLVVDTQNSEKLA